METLVTTQLSENTFLSFEKARVQPLTINQLGRTYKENDIWGNPIKGIYHVDLLNKVNDIARGHGYSTEFFDLFAANNKDRNQPGVVINPALEQQFGERAIEAHVLRRVFANIRIKDFDTDEYTTNLSIAFHQKGIQAGFGNNVIICHNQCMLNPDRYAATYGKGKEEGMELDQLLHTINVWFETAREGVELDRQKIERMKDTQVSIDRFLLLVGTLTAMRIAVDTNRKEIRKNTTYPLNQGQISAFTEDLLLKREINGGITVWDMYNSATELYKATSMDIPAIMPQNRAMVQFLNEQFELV